MEKWWVVDTRLYIWIYLIYSGLSTGPWLILTLLKQTKIMRFKSTQSIPKLKCCCRSKATPSQKLIPKVWNRPAEERRFWLSFPDIHHEFIINSSLLGLEEYVISCYILTSGAYRFEVLSVSDQKAHRAGSMGWVCSKMASYGKYPNHQRLPGDLLASCCPNGGLAAAESGCPSLIAGSSYHALSAESWNSSDHRPKQAAGQPVKRTFAGEIKQQIIQQKV